ncbi:MAG: transporter substrate-binding domain-containing protein [Pseudomonadaceae bacterium]|nr:transporter substrate-binding domain-containing protein [Pseudomonadaceae bacterium]
MVRTLLICLLLCCSCPALAAELLWGFGPADGMPYVEVREQRLVGGFTKLLGERVAELLGLQVRFVEVPNNRLESSLAQGRIQLICNANPAWMEQSARWHWSAPLYEEQDVLLQHRQQPPITSLASLDGKTLGTTLGFVYTEELMHAFADSSVQRKDVRDLETRLQMVAHQRLDALIDMRRPLAYHLARTPDLPLSFSPWVVQRYSMHCAYGPTLPVASSRLDATLLQLRDSGEIAALLQQAERSPPQ